MSDFQFSIGPLARRLLNCSERLGEIDDMLSDVCVFIVLFLFLFLWPLIFLFDIGRLTGTLTARTIKLLVPKRVYYNHGPGCVRQLPRS